jgi:hypothetical protein
MLPSIFTWIVVAGCFRQATAAALTGGWNQPITTIDNDLGRRDPLGFTAAVVATSFDTIWSRGDPRRPRTPGFGMVFKVDEGAGLFAPCPTIMTNPDDCMVGFCIDDSLCSTVCGELTAAGFQTITWYVTDLDFAHLEQVF